MLLFALSLLMGCGVQPPPPASPPAPVTVATPVVQPVAPTPAVPEALVVAAAPLRLITGAGVRVRQTPDPAAKEVVKLSLGDLVTELEVSAQRVKVGATEDVWVRVRTADGKEGWVFGALTQHVEPAQRLDALAKLAEPRITADTKVFADLADLVLSLERLLPTVRGDDALRVRWLHLRALGAALEALGGEEITDPGRKGFIETHQELAFYDEIGGRWIVRSDAIGALATQAKGTALAEPIAWTAAQWPRGGECEGDPYCVLGAWLITDGAYLSEFPRGAHAAQAIDTLRNTLRYVANEAEMRPGTAEETTDLLGQFDKVKAAFVAAAPDDKALMELFVKGRARVQKK